MDIQFKIELNEGVVQTLMNVVQCDTTELEEVMSQYGKAALSEYIQMFVGRRSFTKGADMLEYRLFEIMRHVLNYEIPKATMVRSHFQMTDTRSKSLVKSMLAKYQHMIDLHAFKKRLLPYIENAQLNEETNLYEADIPNEENVAFINRVLARIDTSLKKVTKKRGTNTIYEIQIPARKALINYLTE